MAEKNYLSLSNTFFIIEDKIGRHLRLSSSIATVCWRYNTGESVEPSFWTLLGYKHSLSAEPEDLQLSAHLCTFCSGISTFPGDPVLTPLNPISSVGLAPELLLYGRVPEFQAHQRSPGVIRRKVRCPVPSIGRISMPTCWRREGSTLRTYASSRADALPINRQGEGSLSLSGNFSRNSLGKGKTRGSRVLDLLPARHQPVTANLRRGSIHTKSSDCVFALVV